METKKPFEIKLSTKLVWGGILGGVLLLSACQPQETYVTRQISEEGPSSVKNTVIQERIGPHGKRRVVEKQVTKEKIQCVGKNGKIIPADTVEECMSQNGRIVDEVVIENQKRRR